MNARSRCLCRARLFVLAAAAVAAVACRPSAAGAESRDEWQQPDRVVADLGLKNGTTVADVGCGSGYFTFRLAKAVGETGKVVAQDIDAKALKGISDRVQKEKIANIEVVRGEAADTKLPTASVDSALVCDVLHHVPAAQRLPLIKDTVRAIKPGGMLFLIDYRKSHDVKFDPYEVLIPLNELIDLGKEAGLVLDAEFHYLKYEVFLRFRKPA